MKNIIWSLKIKWKIRRSLMKKMVNDDEFDDEYKVPDTSRVDEISFIEPEATSTLQLRQEINRDKINTLYRHLNVTGNLNLIELDRFQLTKNPNKGATIFEFYNCDRWVSLTKQTSEFLHQKF